MKKTIFNIPIEEKVRILNLHESATKNLYLLGEQNNVKKIEPKKFTLPNNTFSGGKYSQFNKEQVDNLINQMNDYLKKLPKNQKITVEVVSSESKVTNYDREKYPSTGNPKEDYKKEKRLEPGSLSRLRAQTMANYLVGKLPPNVQIVIKDLGAQGPNWEPPQNATPDEIRKLASDEQFTKYQYVSFDILAQGENDDTKSICNLNDEAQGGLAPKEKNYVFVEKTIDISNLPNGQKIKFTFLPAEVPDMLLVTAGGKNYTTGFVGMPGNYWPIMLATVLGNTYNGKPPAPFPQDIKPIDYQTVLEKIQSNQYLKDILGHVVKIDWNKKYSKQVEQIKWYNFDKNPILSNTSDPDFGGKYGGSIIITKDSSMSSLTYRVYSPIGTTVWKLFARCI